MIEKKMIEKKEEEMKMLNQLSTINNGFNSLVDESRKTKWKNCKKLFKFVKHEECILEDDDFDRICERELKELALIEQDLLKMKNERILKKLMNDERIISEFSSVLYEKLWIIGMHYVDYMTRREFFENAQDGVNKCVDALNIALSQLGIDKQDFKTFTIYFDCRRVSSRLIYKCVYVDGVMKGSNDIEMLRNTTFDENNNVLQWTKEFFLKYENILI